MRKIFWFFEDVIWNIKCKYSFWLHGPYGLAKVIEKMPFRYILKYLRKYGATIGENCRFERGLNIHRPVGKHPFDNLIINDNVYLGHNILLDLTKKIIIEDGVMIGARSQIWTHAGYYKNKDNSNYLEKTDGVLIKEGAIIYSNVIISPGVTIGTMVSVGASSFINKNLKEFCFYAGVPSKLIS